MPGTTLYGPGGRSGGVGAVGGGLGDLLGHIVADLAGTVKTTGDQDFAGEKTALDDFFFHRERPFLSLAGFKADGIDPSGGNDSQPATQVAVSECEDAGKSLFVDPGIYAMSAIHFPGDENFVTLTKGLNIWARPGTATFVVDELRPAWKSVFGSATHATDDLTDLDIYGLTFDAQGHINNPVTAGAVLNPSDPAAGEAAIAGQTRAMIQGFFGGRIRVRRCVFKRPTGRNVIFLVTAFVGNEMWDAEVSDCVFEDVGTPNSWHDHATVYLDGKRAALRRPTFLGRPHANGSWSSAWSPYEVHGEAALVDDVYVENFASCGLLVSSRPGNIGGIPEGHVARNVRGRNVGAGVQIQPQQASRDWDIQEHVVIAPDQWPIAAGPATGSALTQYPGLKARSMAAIQASSVTPGPVRIHDSSARWLPAVGGYNGEENALNWERFANRAPVDDLDVVLENVVLIDPPASWVRASRIRSLRGWVLRNVKGRNLGKAGLGAKHQAMFSVGRQVWSGARPVGLADVTITDCTLIDDQAVSTFRHILQVDTPEQKADPAVGTTAESVVITTTTTNLHDAGSLIAHPNLAADTYLATVRVFAAGSTFDVVEWNVARIGGGAAGATATAVAAAIYTSQPPTTDNVRVERPNISLADGSNPNLLKLEAGESAYIDGKVQRPSIVSGPGGAVAGSSFLAPTGLRRRQDTQPSGNLWLPAEGNPLRLSVPVVAWYDALHLSHLDDGAVPAQWTDISGNNRHAPLAAGAPTLRRTGGPTGQPVVRFVPGDAFKVAFTLAQPYAVVLVARHRVSTGTQTWVDGNALNSGLIQKNSSHFLQLYAGSFLILNGAGDAPGLSWFVAVAVFNGAASNLRRNGGAGVTGNPGAAVPGGITIGANASFAAGADGDIMDVIVFGGIPTAIDLNTLSYWVAPEAGIAWARVT